MATGRPTTAAAVDVSPKATVRPAPTGWPWHSERLERSWALVTGGHVTFTHTSTSRKMFFAKRTHFSRQCRASREAPRAKREAAKRLERSERLCCRRPCRKSPLPLVPPGLPSEGTARALPSSTRSVDSRDATTRHTPQGFISPQRRHAQQLARELFSANEPIFHCCAMSAIRPA